jgi:predicted RNase H-like nuclease
MWCGVVRSAWEPETTFIGVDLAWQSAKNHTGVAVARGDVQGATLVAYSDGLSSLEAVLEYVLAHTTSNTVVAIDAPLVLHNPTGQRPCERRISQRFGARHAGAHTSNLGLYPNAGSVRLAEWLQEAGFSHDVCPARDRERSGRWLFEVYPHPAQVTLFDLPRILKYKKGRVAERRAGLRQLQCYLREALAGAVPPLRTAGSEPLLDQDVEALRGQALKHYEDLLDAYFCAYLALFYWRWGGERNEMIGDMQSGYIINPTTALPSRSLR